MVSLIFVSDFAFGIYMKQICWMIYRHESKKQLYNGFLTSYQPKL